MNQNNYAGNQPQFGQTPNQFNPPQTPYQPNSPNNNLPKQSKIGIASLILGVLASGLTIITFAAVKLLQMRGVLVDWTIIAVLLLGVIGGLTGAILGFSTLLTKNTKKVFGVLGLVLNLFFLSSLILDVIYENLNKF